MAERILKNRRRRASKGHLIRISDHVWNTLQKKRTNNTYESWDSLLRRMLGLPNRKGELQPLIEGWLEVISGQFYLKENEARGAAVWESAKRKTKQVPKPIKLREVV